MFNCRMCRRDEITPSNGLNSIRFTLHFKFWASLADGLSNFKNNLYWPFGPKIYSQVQKKGKFRNPDKSGWKCLEAGSFLL
jgi:hypothetical protein